MTNKWLVTFITWTIPYLQQKWRVHIRLHTYKHKFLAIQWAKEIARSAYKL